MAKVLTEAQITTRNARSKLAPGLHWRGIDPDTHLGYRRGERGGRWLVRWYKGQGAYGQETIATADDAIEADGDQTLSFPQAAAKARQLVEHRRAETAAKAAGPIVTVRMAVDEYLAEREGRDTDGPNKRDARSRLTKHVLANDKLAATQLFALPEGALIEWKAGLKKIAGTTIRRLSNDFKAALNLAAKHHRATLPANIGATIKNGLAASKGGKTKARRAQVLPDKDIRSIIQAAIQIDAEDDWGGDLARLVMVLAATGARFSQIARMTVADVQPDKKRLMVPVSHKGKGAKERSHEPVQVGADVLAALRSATAGRKAGEPLLVRPRWKQTSPTEWRLVGRAAWHSAAELSRPWVAIVAKAKLAAGTVPYALRHSSIVRGIRAGLPIRLVAVVHDTSTAMIERHYAAFIASALDELAGRAVVPLMPEETNEPTVVQLRA